jgi:hypothetical protein
MEPTRWGPHLWFYLHTISFNFPDNPTHLQKTQHLDFYNSLGNTIPCEKCKNHYASHLQTQPPRLENRDSIIRWTVDLHNRVNKSLGKREWTYDEAVDAYRAYFKGKTGPLDSLEYSSNDKIKDSNNRVIAGIQITVIILAIILSSYYLIRNHKKSLKKIIWL